MRARALACLRACVSVCILEYMSVKVYIMQVSISPAT